MVNIVIFGIGKTYQDKKFFFNENRDRINIVAFLDNNIEYQGKILDGITILAPENVTMLNIDGVVILSKKFRGEMLSQLLSIGIEQRLIWDFDILKRSALIGKRTIYNKQKNITGAGKGKVLVIATDMDFSGGNMVAVYATLALRKRGYEVMLAAPSINNKLLEEIIREGISVAIWDCLPYIFREDEAWISEYDVVLVNVFQMMNCAYQISKIRPVLWWIHENRSIWQRYYEDTQKNFSNINTKEWMRRVEVLGVSNIAKEAFNYFYPDVIERVLPFGIPDKKTEQNTKRSLSKRVIFAVTAGFAEFKGQSVLIEAVAKLTKEEREAIEIWFIGPSGESQKILEEMCAKEDKVIFFGLLAHEEVIKVLPQIDVIVCPSLIETMSMSTIEGMMFEKLCIVTDQTGISEYIEDGRNGFVVKANDPEQLSERISWIIGNRNMWEPIKREARRTFEREFSLEIFGDRLETELAYCKEKYYENLVNVSAPIS